MIEKYYLKNLDCASCAERIEVALNKLPEVNFASVNFANLTLQLDAQDVSAITKTIKELEPEIELLPLDIQLEDNNSNKPMLIRISASAAILIMALFFEDQINLIFLNVILSFAYILVGGSVIVQAIKNIWKKNWFDETFLMSVATLGAIVIQEFPEAVGVMLFYQLGEYIQGKSVASSRNSIKALLQYNPTTANLVTSESILQVDSKEVAVGSIILVRTGEKIPLDGEVIEGNSMVDTHILTGESIPRNVSAGDAVFAGGINGSGTLQVKVTAPYSNSSIIKMLTLVEDAASRKSKTQNFITRFAKIYTPIVVSLAALVAFVPPFVFPEEQLADWVYRALILLVISCPCALVISIPLGYFGGIGAASKSGILIKGANYLDVLAETTQVIFDKTGTLTKGKMVIKDILPANGISEQELLKIAATVEAHSTHPIAKSLIKAYDLPIEYSVVTDIEEIPGEGIKGKYSNSNVYIGTIEWLKKHQITSSYKEDLYGSIHIAIDQNYYGCISMQDALKDNTENIGDRLRNIGIEKVSLLTGDRDEIAKNLAMKLGFDDYKADCLPQDKIKWMEEQLAKNKNGKTAYVGDGINDAPVLARADVGIAMGALGSDAAIETADVVLLTDSPKKVEDAIVLGRRTRNIVRQNIALALVVKLMFIGLGIWGLPTMWEAVFADVGVSLLAVLNSTRISKIKISYATR